MQLVETFESGACEWVCPICDRRFIVGGPPNHEIVILYSGEWDAGHYGGAIELDFSSPSPVEENMAQWQEWLADMDFSSLQEDE